MYKIHPKTKFELFKKKKHFCSAPWNLMYVDMSGTIKTCNKGSEIFGNLSLNSAQDIIHSDKMCNLRQNILEDVKTKNCTGCIKLENCGNNNENYTHLRNNYNTLFRNADVNYSDTNEFVLSGLDLHWSSVCDLKCVTCWAGQSSSIAKEQNVPVQHTPKHIANQLIEYIDENQHTLKEVYLSGGEPTLINYNLQLLQKLIKRPDLLIRVNSNMMWDTDNRILQEILKFPNVLFTCSADALEEKFEYIRRGASWKKFVKNLRFLQNYKNVELRINSVFFALQSTELINTIDYFSQEMSIVNFTINQCGMGQTHLRCRNLPQHVKNRVKSSLESAIQKYHYDLNLVGQFNNCLEELNCPQTEEYHTYLDHIDQLQGSNWKLIFKDIL